MLLELMEVIERKEWNINRGLITVGIDNKKVYRRILSEILKPSIHTQDTGAIIAQIRRILQKIKFTVEFKLIKGHSKQLPSFEQRPLEYLIRKCDQAAKETRVQVNR